MIMVSVKRKTTPTMLVLIGIGVMYLFNAFTMIMKYRAEPDVLKQIQLWSIGSLTGIGWSAVYVLFATLIALLIFMLCFSRKMDVMASGENQSISLGVRPDRVRIICMVAISACTSVAVAFSGAIGFVGLIIPHLSRLFVGSKSKMLIPCSAVLGALLLIASDVVARLLGNGLPVGAVTAVIGSPVFIYFLIKMRSNGWGK
jgi:ABC-type Fe3+-siderophore transport system permease subunit